MSQKLAKFTPEILSKIQAHIMATEVDESITECCPECSTKMMTVNSGSPAIYRCTECAFPTTMCSTCLIEKHVQLPFHHIQAWTGLFFVKASLCDIGHVLYLGHGGNPCPNLKQSTKSTSFVIVHKNGLHNTSIHYCHCNPELDRVSQLINHQLFPPTLDVPQTAFTFNVLDDFHRLSLTAKISAYDYYKALKRHTNAVTPRTVPVRWTVSLITLQIC